MAKLRRRRNRIVSERLPQHRGPVGILDIEVDEQVILRFLVALLPLLQCECRWNGIKPTSQRLEHAGIQDVLLASDKDMGQKLLKALFFREFFAHFIRIFVSEDENGREPSLLK